METLKHWSYLTAQKCVEQGVKTKAAAIVDLVEQGYPAAEVIKTVRSW